MELSIYKRLIKLYKITKEENIYKAINEALDFITNRMVSSETIYSCFNEEPCFPGYLDDYALLGSVLIDYLSIEWNQNYYDTCMRVCDDLMNNFEDKEKVVSSLHRTNMNNYFTVQNLSVMTPYHLDLFMQQIHCCIWDSSQEIKNI